MEHVMPAFAGFCRSRWIKAVAVGLVVVATVLASALVANPAAKAATGGPIVLMGIDAENGGPGGHGPIGVYESVLNDLLGKVSNGGTGILVIGAGKDVSDDATLFWNQIATDTGQAVTLVNGAAAISSQSFPGFKVIAVVSDNTFTFGGLTAAEHDALSARQAEVAGFVNGGGGLLGFSSDFANPYAYLAGVGAITATTGHFYEDITPTPDGAAIGITDDLDICCWHDEYTAFPAFLSVLATNAASGNAAAIGGANVVVPGACTITGTVEDDVLHGTPGDDVICGLGGDDRLFGEEGNDKLLGGTGNDWLEGGTGRDRLVGYTGQDRLMGGTAADRLFGGPGADQLSGDTGDDQLEGNEGDDRLAGGPGEDQLNGGTGQDRLDGNSGDDILRGGPDSDTLVGGPDADHCNGGPAIDTAATCESIIRVP